MNDDRVPAPLEAIVRAVAGGARGDDDERATTFARGLALGALVGAAIAGSTIWQRRQQLRHGARPEPASDDGQAAPARAAEAPSSD